MVNGRPRSTRKLSRCGTHWQQTASPVARVFHAGISQRITLVSLVRTAQRHTPTTVVRSVVGSTLKQERWRDMRTAPVTGVSRTKLEVMWREVQALPEANGREVSVTYSRYDGPQLLPRQYRGPWYANIRHEKGYTVWYMPGKTPFQAMKNLRDALNKRRVLTAQ